MQNIFEARSLSRVKIRGMAKLFRKRIGISEIEPVDIIEVLDIKMPQLYPELSVEIVEKEDMHNLHGLTIPDKNEIRIREDVYDGAVNGNGRDRMTIAHEIFHFIFHRGNNIVSLEGLGRSASNLPAYKNAEWQANAFAGELLMPSCKIKDMTIDEIMKEYGVSSEAARMQKSKV